MYHHDGRKYDEAVSAAGKAGRELMEKIIANGRASALAVVEQVQSQIPVDRVIKTSALSVVPGNDGFNLMFPDGWVSLHDNALGQVANKMGVPGKYLEFLAAKGDWGKELAAENLTRLLHKTEGRNLIRSVCTKNGDEARGFLSDKFRRLDSRPLLDSFIGACEKVGAVPINGYALDTKVRMRAVLPIVFEPVKDEVQLWGLEWGNSDFGASGHCLNVWNMRVWCTNLAVRDQVMRQIHLGKRLEDEIEYSERTMELDTRANQSALADVVKDALSPRRIEGYNDTIRQAVKTEVSERDIGKILNGLGKSDQYKVADLYNGPDVVNLPAGKNLYRLSNAVSWFAQSDGISQARKLALEETAGAMLPQVC